MKPFGWQWANSKQKRAEKIMWETQGQDYDIVISQIMEDCQLDNLNARQLYRKMARTMEQEGFVPAPIKRGRPRKTDVPAAAPSRMPRKRSEARDASHPDVYNASHPVMQLEPEPEPERTTTGERKSIADMKSFLEQLKRKAG